MPAPKDGPDKAKPTGVRIAKFIARSGLCSRRDAEALIGEKRVSVNGAIIESPALDVLPADSVLVDGKPLSLSEPPRLWRYYKPKGRVTTHKDPEGRPTVFEALPEELPRLISVGRLDFNTEGLLLLTNDGDLARHLELPSTGWTRRYRVRAYGRVDQAKLQELAGGLTIGRVNYGPIEASLEREQGDNVWIGVAIREGKNREVRRIMEHLDLAVNRLIRVSFGPFMLGDLEPGQIEEVKTSVLKDQLGPRLSRQLGVKREPMREERRLAPARAKPTYLRRKPGAPVRPARAEEEARPLRRRRILPMDGSEAPKVEFVAERKPRVDRFSRSDGGARRPDRDRREGRPQREDRDRPAGHEGGQPRGKPYGSGASPGAGFKGREGSDREFGRDRSERRDPPPSFRERPNGERGASPRFDRPERSGAQSAAGPQGGGRSGPNRPPYAGRKEGSPAGERPARTFRAERREDRPRSQFDRRAERNRPGFESRNPGEGREEQPRSSFRRGAEGAPAALKDRGPRREHEGRPRPQFRGAAEEGQASRINRKPGERSPYRGGDKPGERRAGEGSFRRREGGGSPRAETSASSQARPAFEGGSGGWRQNRAGGKPPFKRAEGAESKRGIKGRPEQKRSTFRTGEDRPREQRVGGKSYIRHERPTKGPRFAGPRKPKPETDKETP
jgi:23S rRNA pseudouridine2605 synthase